MLTSAASDTTRQIIRVSVVDSATVPADTLCAIEYVSATAPGGHHALLRNALLHGHQR